MIQPHHYKDFSYIQLNCGHIYSKEWALDRYINKNTWPCMICKKTPSRYSEMTPAEIKETVQKIEIQRDKQLVKSTYSDRQINPSDVIFSEKDFFEEAAKGIDPNSCCKDGIPLLCHAVRNGSKRIIQAILTMKPKQEHIQEALYWIAGKIGQEPYHRADNYEGQDFFLMEDLGGLTIPYGYLGSANEIMQQIAEKLIAHGAKIDIHIAAAIGNKEFVENFLKEGGDINLLNSNYGVIIDYFIGSTPSKDHCTPLGWAARRGQYEIVDYLLINGAKVNESGCQTLPIHDAIRGRDLKTLQRIIEAGGNLDALDKYGKTPICKACTNVEILELLLKSGANPNLESNGDTPIDDLLAYTTKDEAILTLLKYGADPNLGNKPIVHAINSSSFKTVANMILYGADLSLKEEMIRHSFTGKKLEEHRLTVTPLERLSTEKCLRVFSHLNESDKEVPEKSRDALLKKINEIYPEVVESAIHTILAIADVLAEREPSEELTFSKDSNKNRVMLESLKKRLTSSSTS